MNCMKNILKLNLVTYKSKREFRYKKINTSSSESGIVSIAVNACFKYETALPQAPIDKCDRPSSERAKALPLTSPGEKKVDLDAEEFHNKLWCLTVAYRVTLCEI